MAKREIHSWLMHMDGVLVREEEPIPGAAEYVVLGETRTYSFERITQALRLIAAGSRFIATNPDATGPTLNGPLPATGSATGWTPTSSPGSRPGWRQSSS
jgi:ribonucleotide monophosphatase NagD (HAD superfamily)